MSYNPETTPAHSAGDTSRRRSAGIEDPTEVLAPASDLPEYDFDYSNPDAPTQALTPAVYGDAATERFAPVSTGEAESAGAVSASAASFSQFDAPTVAMAPVAGGEYPTVAMAPVEAGEYVSATPAAAAYSAVADSEAEEQLELELARERERAARKVTSKAAVAITILGCIASIALAALAWGGLFPLEQLYLVIAGIALFTFVGLIGVWRTRGTWSLLFVWIVAGILLFAPLLGWLAVSHHGDLKNQLIVGAISLWWSGVAAVSLAVAVLATYLQARARSFVRFPKR